MDKAFWEEIWQNNNIGFHQQRVNPALITYWPSLRLSGTERVFVPLCGKSLDMLWLREQGHQVIGVELSEIALAAFFAENDLPFEQESRGAFTIWRSAGIELWQGDYFALPDEATARVTAVYDRAALVAMPGEKRSAYAKHLITHLPPDGQSLILTFDYAAGEISGPPFAVSEAEVRALFGPSAAQLELLEAQNRLPDTLRQRGLSRLLQLVFLYRKGN